MEQTQILLSNGKPAIRFKLGPSGLMAALQNGLKMPSGNVYRVELWTSENEQRRIGYVHGNGRGWGLVNPTNAEMIDLLSQVLKVLTNEPWPAEQLHEEDPRFLWGV